MKRLTRKLKERNTIHADILQRRRTRKEKPQKKRRRLPPIQPDLLAKTLGRQLISAPENLTLHAKTATETIRFTRKITEIVSAGTSILLDFSQTKMLTAVGAVYLFSEINRSQHRQGQTILTHLKGASSMAWRLLRSSGLLQLIDGKTQPTGDILPILSGQNDDHVDEIVDFLTKRAVFDRQLGGVDSAWAKHLTGAAITEAMLNVKYHAYPDKSTARWWMTAAIIDSEINIALCDRGVGIPATLPRHGWFEKLQKLNPIGDDAKMIKAAMEYARTSRSDRQGRGLGTRDIQNLVLDQKRGHLTIISGKGHYRLIGETGKVEINSINEDVRGTVIQWTIPMKTTNQGKV